MKTHILLAAGLSLAFATCAFAQDPAPAASSSTDATAPAPDAKAGDMKKPAMKHHGKHRKAHVAGDPTHIDHRDDHMAVANPTESKLTIPAGQ